MDDFHSVQLPIEFEDPLHSHSSAAVLGAAAAERSLGTQKVRRAAEIALVATLCYDTAAPELVSIR
eukprot:SAG31_NODE_5462_length_2523_cov_2.836634_1_plen_66_part_00